MASFFAQAFSNTVYRIFAITLILLFTLSIIINQGDDVLWINGHYSTFGDQFFKYFTHLGDGFVFLPFIIILLFIRYQYAITGVAIAIVHGIFVSIFKQLLFHGAPRPKAFLGSEVIHFVEGVTVHASNSFPSGHTTTAFSLALFVAYIFRNTWITCFSILYALLVGYSRIYLAQHFLMDVAAGAIVGCFTTFVACLIMEANQQNKGLNGRLILKRWNE